jgi:hypothetical protein
MRNISKKRLATIAGGTAIVMAGAGVGYAYWTTGGSGSGSAAVGHEDANLGVVGTVHQGDGALQPGGPSVQIDLAVTNSNTYSAHLKNDVVTITPGSITCGAQSVPDDWFSIVNGTISNDEDVPAKSGTTNGTATLSPSGVTLEMNDSSDNQNVCQSATVSFDLAVATASPLP